LKQKEYKPPHGRGQPQCTRILHQTTSTSPSPNEILFQKLFGSSTCKRITLINTKEGLISRTLTILVQKQFSTPHKAHNLTDGGRGGRKSLEQHNQYYTQQLAQIKKIKIHKIRNKLTPKVL
jgi:hypothetical protein